MEWLPRFVVAKVFYFSTTHDSGVSAPSQGYIVAAVPYVNGPPPKVLIRRGWKGQRRPAFKLLELWVVGKCLECHNAMIACEGSRVTFRRRVPLVPTDA